jgi:signal transduction histidine kinase/ActR/RegA family two-component response regulator
MAKADAYPFPTLPAPLRFAIALAAVGIVYTAKFAYPALIDSGSQLLLLSTAVMASAWLAGTGPALAATVVGALIGAWDASISEANDRAAHTHLALLVVHGLLLTAVVSELRSARRVAEQRVIEAQEARQESETAGRMKDEFLATISHELRTPLNAVLGWVHLLRTGKLDPATAARGMESIQRNVRLQAQLTSDLLDVSRALTGRLRMEPQAVSITSAVKEAMLSVQASAQAKGVELKTHFPETAVAVLGDPTRLRQIVWHLLANAIKFTTKGGVVEVSVDATSDLAVLTVLDSGPGIAPDFLPRIFDRFAQEDASPTRTAGGLGVGLSLVRELVELHGGDIQARNREDRTGAIFRVTLPLQSASSLEASGPATTIRPLAPLPAVSSVRPSVMASSTLPLDGLRVLVLDQDAEGRDLLRTVLQQRGATVRTAASVADALEALESWRPDALLTDSVSPEHDSYALIGKVQWLEAERGGRIPAVALTAYGRTDERVRQMLDAVKRDLPKPIEPSVLTAEIAKLTGRERRRAARSH